MKTTLNAIKVGKIINIWLNGTLRKKVCETEEIANSFFKTVLKVKENPDEDGVKNLLCYLNEKSRIALKCGLESDPDTGNIYLAGFNTPIPQTLAEVIESYYDNGFPMEAIINFWKLLMLNPDKRVRETLFDFIKTHDFVLTDTGYMVVYKAVRSKNYKKSLKIGLLILYHNVLMFIPGECPGVFLP